jgi:zinc protease
MFGWSVGRADHGVIVSRLNLFQLFGDLPEVALPQIDDFKLSNAGKTFLYKQDIPQTIIEVSQPGIGRQDPDYHTAQVMNFILGSSGFGSRLTEVIREKRGLTYGIYSSFTHYDAVDVMNVSSSTVNQSAPQLLSLLKEECKKMRDSDVTEKELTDAKTYLIGALPLSLTSTDSISSLLLSLRLDDLPVDYLDRRTAEIQNVTLADVRKLSQRLLDPDRFTIVLVGNPQGLKNVETLETLPNAE